MYLIDMNTHELPQTTWWSPPTRQTRQTPPFAHISDIFRRFLGPRPRRPTSRKSSDDCRGPTKHTRPLSSPSLTMPFAPSSRSSCLKSRLSRGAIEASQHGVLDGRSRPSTSLALAEAVAPIHEERRPALERLVLQRPKVGRALDEEVGERGASLCGGGREGDARELERVALVLQLAGSPDAVVADVGRPRSHARLAVRHAPSRHFKPLRMAAVSRLEATAGAAADLGVQQIRLPQI